MRRRVLNAKTERFKTQAKNSLTVRNGLLVFANLILGLIVITVLIVIGVYMDNLSRVIRSRSFVNSKELVVISIGSDAKQIEELISAASNTGLDVETGKVLLYGLNNSARELAVAADVKWGNTISIDARYTPVSLVEVCNDLKTTKSGKQVLIVTVSIQAVRTIHTCRSLGVDAYAWSANTEFRLDTALSEIMSLWQFIFINWD